ncbi:MAG: 50S ribosomal protein L29 [Candidatus Nealsonbacteria bacterium RIFOXYB1_FULL_40_15]|uniref:Large ribosomal subunit protein uL29 n=2 Tax=Candidatus Nealsoniibacteriota TaxID=1817911 RepID=A0A1G2ELK3_9BACT|nr:MAG: 50S ribosomal protein L29 [Candidatus Nealsonbacteria bacterium RIFOXYC1_FULL_40_7]OGZ27815.1 MAG: 50S ribosomal protein L29 [Candidatus Nealsonbacteria bacterium RIFOXYB1_FULL_40_15]OGZ28933.1 MAG: 50S ribosomal protein L29 [Candidatus Nealsonbacteria bacterium RIFOXYD1_FULL_39_11]
MEDFSKKPAEELKGLLKENREKLRQMRFDLAAGKVKDIRSIRSVKKNIARMLTFLNKNKNA